MNGESDEQWRGYVLTLSAGEGVREGGDGEREKEKERAEWV